MYHQQGDVILTKVAQLPKTAKKLNADKIVLALGEATGHSHTALAPAEGYEMNGITFIVVPEGTVGQVRHQTHNPIFLSPGIWRVGAEENGGVREYNHFEEEHQAVRD